MSFGKDIATYFFTKEGEEVGADNKVKTIFKCNSAHLIGKECASKGLFKVVISNGYTNLRSHLTICIPNWQSIYDERGIRPVGDDIRQYVKVDKKSYNIYKWIEWVVQENLAFSFCDKKLTRENSSREPISRTSLMKYLDCLAWAVQLVLSSIVPDQFGLLFDGWVDGNSTNYFGVFVIWWDEKREQNRVYLLRLCPLVKCDNYGADSHVEPIVKFLGGIGKTMANVSVIMGDNCTTNISLANKAHKPFIGCYSHRLNLAV